jgi:hypothetical protein
MRRFVNAAAAVALGSSMVLGCHDTQGVPYGDTGNFRDAHADGQSAMGCNQISRLEKSDLFCDGDLGVTVPYSQEFGAFSIPEDTLAEGMPISGEEAREFYGSDVEDGQSFGFNESIAATSHDVGYVEFGSDVKFHFLAVHDREAYDSSRAQMTTLLNLEPVDAKYENYNSDRSVLEHETVGDSAIFPIDSDIEQYDVTIPSDAFDEPGRYSIAFSFSGKGRPNTAEYHREFTVFYGGCTPQPMPCFAEAGEASEKNEDEIKLTRNLFLNTFIYPAGKYASADPTEPLRVESGEKVTFDYSTDLQSSDFTAALVPLIDGTPVGEPHLWYFPEKPEDFEPNFQPVAGRGSFEIEMPEEPGKYVVGTAQNINPIFTQEEAETIGIRAVTFDFGSNDIEVIVE